MGSEPLAGQWAKGKGLGLNPKEEGLKGLQTVIRAALYLGGGGYGSRAVNSPPQNLQKSVARTGQQPGRWAERHVLRATARGEVLGMSR